MYLSFSHFRHLFQPVFSLHLNQVLEHVFRTDLYRTQGFTMLRETNDVYRYDRSLARHMVCWVQMMRLDMTIL